MSDEWKSVALSGIAHVQQGRTLAVKAMTGGDHPVFGANGVIGYFTEGTYEHPTVALGCRGSCGTVHTAPAGSYLANNVMGIWPKDTEVTSLEWLAYALEGADLVSSGVISGQVQPQITRRSLEGLRVLLPPLAVQRRIVDLLAHLDNHLANLQTERDAAESARLASLESRLRSVEGETKRLGDVLDIARGGSPRPIDDYFTDSPDGLNWIKIGDVPPEGRYITGTAQKIRPEGLSKTRQVKSGDFLLSNSMSFGRPYILRIDGCIHDGWLVLAGVERAFDPEYLYFLLRSNGVQDQFRSLAAGSGVKNLNIKVVNSVEVVVPTKEVQAYVAADASAWMELIEDLDAEITSLRQFRQFILSALLSGDLALPATYDSLISEVA